MVEQRHTVVCMGPKTFVLSDKALHSAQVAGDATSSAQELVVGCTIEPLAVP